MSDTLFLRKNNFGSKCFVLLSLLLSDLVFLILILELWSSLIY